MNLIILKLTTSFKNVILIIFVLCIYLIIPEYLKANEPIKSELLKVDYAKLVSNADLHYTSPVLRSEEGMPVGNGTMGSLVWTTSDSLKLQINRVDVFANDASSDNFYERHTEYCGGVGFVDFDFILGGESTFSGPSFEQHLSCYNGLVTVQGKGIKAEVFVWADQDVMAGRWNQKTDVGWEDGLWINGDKGGGAFGHVTHIFSRGAKIAYQFWMKYEYTNDKDWLKNNAYLMIKGVAEFYRNFPNFKKDENGVYTISHVNDNESIWDASNTIEEISAMRGIFPVAIRASEILEVDIELRKQWKEILEHLAPMPLNTNFENVSNSEQKQWIKALPPVGKGNYASHPDPNTMPVWFFDLCNLGNENQEILDIANTTFDSYFRDGINAESKVFVLSKLPVACSILGRKESTKFLIPNQIKTAESEVLINRMTLREGYQTTGVQRLGRVADALHLALFQSAPENPGGKPVIFVFPAWPENWNASFSLLGRGNFFITSSMKNNNVEFVEIKSLSGLPCKIVNPWKGIEVTLFADGKEINHFEGTVISFTTKKDSNYILVKKGTSSNSFKRTIVP